MHNTKMKRQLQVKKQMKVDSDVYVQTYRQAELSWRVVLFLPFNVLWRLSNAIMGLIQFSILIYYSIFMMQSYTIFPHVLVIVSVMNVAFMFDLVLSITHKYWTAVNNSRIHLPKSLLVLTLDTLSLLPIKMFIPETLLRTNHTIQWWAMFNLNGCLRIYSVFLEMKNLQNRIDMNPIVVSMITHNALFIVLATVLSSIYYVMGYTYMTTTMTPVKTSWLMEIKKLVMGINDPFMMLLFCFSILYCTLNNFVIVELEATNMIEGSYRLILLYVGFVLKYGFIMASMILSNIKYYSHLYMIKEFIALNIKCITQEKTKEIEDYCNMFWQDWLGLNKCPLLNTFPLCLQKDIMTDVYWQAMNHSHILRYFSKSIKREISLVMESRFMQPGDHIFRKGEIRNTFFYVANGVVQIMSHYDGISPIMTISSGSCLGNLALTLPSPSPTDITCATFCEVRCLTYANLRHVLRLYPEGFKILLETQKEHVQHFRLMYSLHCAYHKPDKLSTIYGIPQTTKLKWIKQRLRIINRCETLIPEVTEKLMERLESKYIPLEKTHTSKYLDMIVLRSEEKWDANKCCLHSHCSYVLEPNCNFLIYWLYFIFIIVTLDCIVLPYWAAFIPSRKFEGRWELMLKWNQLIAFLYLIDIYFQAITAVRYVDKIITDPMPLLRHHLKDVRFLCDIFASLPVPQVIRLFSMKEIPSYIEIIRLLKVVRIICFFQYKHRLILDNTKITNLLKYAYLFFFLTYFAASFAFMMSCWPVDGKYVCLEDGWFEHGKAMRKKYGLNEEVNCYGYNLLNAFYYVLSFTLAAGTKDIPPKDMFDILFCVLLIWFSSNVFLYTNSEFIVMWFLTRKRKVAYKEFTSVLQKLLHNSNVHKGLRKMTFKYIKLQWKVNHCIGLEKVFGDTTEITTPMLLEDRRKTITEAVKKVPFFNEMEPDLLNKVLNEFHLFTLPPGYIFCRSGEHPACFNVILKGHCDLKSMLKEDCLQFEKGHMIGPDSYFPLMEILMNVTCFQTTVSTTFCQVASIEATILRSILYADEHTKRTIMLSTTIREKEMDIVVSKTKYRREKEHVPNLFWHSKARRDSEEFSPSSGSKKKRSSFPCLPFFINPEGNFMFFWELLTNVQILASLIFFIQFYTTFCYLGTIKFLIALFFDVWTFVDMYVRFNLGYYNKKGLLAYNLSYYPKHAFTIDILSGLPFYYLVDPYDVHIKFFFVTFFKGLQIYRLNGIINVVVKRYSIDDFFSLIVNFMLHFIIVCLMMSNCMFVISCRMKCLDDGTYDAHCDKITWYSSNEYTRKVKDPFELIMFSYEMLLNIIFGNWQNAFRAVNTVEMTFVCVVAIGSCICRMYIISKVSSFAVGRRTYFTRHRENVKLYWLFIADQGGDYALANTIQKHFLYVHSRCRGLQILNFINTLHPSLKSDLSFAIFYQATRVLHKYVGPGKSFIKLLMGAVLKELYFRKETTILSRNEVNQKIFFIVHGLINVYDEEDELITTLGVGSLFGCLDPAGKIRQRLTFRCHLHTNVLQVKVGDFFHLLQSYSRRSEWLFLRQTLDKNKVRSEYIEYNNDIIDFMNEYIIEQRKNYEQMKINRYPLLYRNSVFFQWLSFVMNSLIPYLSIFPVVQFIVYDEEHENLYYYTITSLIYTLDVILYFRIYIGLNTTYTDESSGLYISDKRFLRIRYLRNPCQFALDVISSFPIEWLAYCIVQKIYRLLMLNRLLRVIIIGRYINYHKERTYVKLWLRWQEIFIYITLIPYIFASVWQYYNIQQGTLTSYFNGVYRPITDIAQMFIISADDIMALITFSPSYEFHKPSNYHETILMMIFQNFNFIIICFVIGSISQMMEKTYYQRNQYENQVGSMKSYLQLRGLSESLLHLLWTYSLLFWKTNHGVDYPYYLKGAPHHLKNDLLHDLYGAHLSYNILFESCSLDFLKQLSGRLLRTVYFPGDFIVYKNDVDRRMYFINSGEVEAIEFDELNVEIVREIHITGHCFGLSQGLYDQTPHIVTYKARNMVEILTLQKNKWEDLLDAFPEERIKIYGIANLMSLNSLL